MIALASAASPMVAALWLAQAAVQPATPPASPSFALAVDSRVERYAYHFDNDSRFDTASLVPHFFEQRYHTGHTGLTFTAGYLLFGALATTECGVTPRAATSGSDFDTFFQPSGDVVTSGTDGGVLLQSFSVRQRFTVSAHPHWSAGLALAYRRSRADFSPSDIVVTHTLPPSTSRTFTTARETTWSYIFETGAFVETTRPIGARWVVTAAATATPATRARLVTALPDTYPGQNVAFEALAFGAEGRVAFERRWSRWRGGIALSVSGTRGYRRTASYEQQAVSVAVFVRAGR